LFHERRRILPLERCGAESLEQNSLTHLLTDLRSLYEYVVKFVYRQDGWVGKTRHINFGICSIFQGKSMTLYVLGLIASHDCALIADLGRVHERRGKAIWRLNVAEHPVLPHKGRVGIH